jgi:hypothetical protein
MLRRSDGSWAKDEKRLQCRKGDQKCDEGVLDRPAALPVLFQAAEVFEGRRSTIDSVRQTGAPHDWRAFYRNAAAEGVTRITAPVSSFRPSNRFCARGVDKQAAHELTS